MKNSVILKLFMIVAFVGSCSLISAQAPFSEEPVVISKSASSSSEKQDKLSIWETLAAKIKHGFNTLTDNLNNALTSDKLPAFVSKSAMIPGHESHEFVCQGICYLPDQVFSATTEQTKPRNYQYAILSYYPKPDYTDEPSQLLIIDLRNGKAIRRFALHESSDTAYTGHAGGIAIAGKYLWVASGYKIYGFEIQAMLDFLNDKNAQTDAGKKGIPDSFQVPALDLTAAQIYAVDSTSSYISFDGKQLWVGDFTKSSDKSFKPVKHHTQNPFKLNNWIAGYKVDADGMPTATQKYTYKIGDKSRTAHKPDLLIFSRESVQGMAICGNYAALSISYGAHNSKLALYKSPLSKPATKIAFKPAGQSKTFTIDGWELSGDANWLKTSELPAGSEDLEFDGKYLYVTFEGASQNYCNKWRARNPLINIEKRFYLINLNTILK